MILDKITEKVLHMIDGEGFKQEGAFNLRENGIAVCHGDSEHVKIRKKEDKQGIDIYIDKNTNGETVHIPVVVSASGMHTFHIGKDAIVHYEEKHYGEGEGTGARILNPVTDIYVGENSVFTMDTVQIQGVDSTKRETDITMEAGSRLTVTEKLMTHDRQEAVSNMKVIMDGDGSSAQIISRSVAKGESIQTFHPRAIGKTACHAHIQCDSIIMNDAQVRSIPEIDARNVDAQIIHEAAIGRINSEQLLKLETFGLNEEEAEGVIIENFLN